MRIVVTGVSGQLGYDVVREATRRGITAIGVDRKEMDITDKINVEQVIGHAQVDCVIHCAGWTAVDKAEEMPTMCRQVNVEGTKNIVSVCKKLDIPMVYFSTDYVFNGMQNEAWKEEDPCDPLNVYGQSKYEGELAVRTLSKYYILRVSWLFGLNGKNFVKTMLHLGTQQRQVSVVNDQVGSPTYTCDLAKLVIDMIQTSEYGVYHVTNEGECSWYDFACEIFKQANMKDVLVTSVDNHAFKVLAKRPLNSRMSKLELDRHGFQRLPSWQDALSRFLIELNNSTK